MEAVPSSPFGVADYLQMASMLARSAVLEIALADGWGRLVIERGVLIAAFDPFGEGVEAFRRLVFAEDVEVVCRTLVSDDTIRQNVRGNLQELLFEAAREADERRRDGGSSAVLLAAADDGSAADDEAWSELLRSMAPPTRRSLVPPLLLVPSTRSARLTLADPDEGAAVGAPSPEAARESFEALVDEATTALLANDLHAAARAYVLAAARRPGDRDVEGNVVRLTALGYWP